MTTIITRENINQWLKKLSDSHTIFAPFTKEGITLYETATSEKIGDIDLDFINSRISPKECFFPQSETIFSISKTEKEQKPETPKSEKNMVVFAVRPCDAKGIALIDKVFLQDPVDAVYQKRREKATLIGLGCIKPCAECFCDSMGGGPFDKTFLDVMLIETGSGFAVEPVTEKGRLLLEKASLSQSEALVPPTPKLSPVPAQQIVEKMPLVFSEDYWNKVADRCVHCNICSYVCPCCYCFDVRDYQSKDKIERIRTWESCQSAGFTKAAGGHDPRPTKGSRLRQRWYHKLLYYPERFKEIKCTGCGRCVRSCPVNIDIREIIADVQKMKVKE